MATMEEAELDAMARHHMRTQVVRVTATQAALSRLWDELVEPNDPRTFERFKARAVPLIMAGRGISQNEAQAYFERLHNVSGLDGDLARVYAPEFRPRYAVSSLDAASGKALDRAGILAAKGASTAATMEVAKRAMLASAKRQVLNAGREHIIALTKTSGYGRWARVSDGSPCAFCRMLVSRGPVYTASSVHFRAHDGCGCSARPVRKDESGWSEQALEARELFQRLDVKEVRRMLDDRARAASLGLAA
ncbi:MuF-like minor capsid protein [Microbacterium phage Honk]|uniref:MuF-like minor capsid protein n=1 Tax=Microbacterium phage Honk TaxID=2836095 RepID=A0A8F3E6T9_9CAUD|nr:MuF-like minor capsid protein [Microbacterium phage Honk]